MSSLWFCPSNIFSADHSVAHPPRCPEGWVWRGCRRVWHASTMKVSVSWQLPEVVPVDRQGSWSCSTPSRWSCAPSRRCGELFSGSWFRKPGAFFFLVVFQRQQAGSTFYELWGGDKTLVQLELACQTVGVAPPDPVLSGHCCHCWGSPDSDFCWAGAIFAQGCSQVLEIGHLL